MNNNHIKYAFEKNIQSIDLIIDEFKAQNASSKVIIAEKNVSSFSLLMFIF